MSGAFDNIRYEPFVLQIDSEGQMDYFELSSVGADDTEKRAYLVEGETVAITIRIPRNLKDTIAQAAALSGLSFSAYVRTCLMNDLLGNV